MTGRGVSLEYDRKPGSPIKPLGYDRQRVGGLAKNRNRKESRSPQPEKPNKPECSLCVLLS